MESFDHKIMTDPIVSYLENQLEAYLADLRTLVSIDSGTQHKAGVDAVTAWLAGRLTKLGFSLERFHQQEVGDNLLATRHGRKAAKILLLGHSDTVFPVGTAATRPMAIKGNKIMGPGTCDMKAGLISSIYALEALQAVGFEDFGTIQFLCISDEESHPRYSIPMIRSVSRQVDVALTLEAARENGDIVTARKTMRWYKIEAIGKAAHAGVEPEKGQNAVLALAHHIVALDRLNQFRPGVTLNIGDIQGGIQPNVVSPYACVRVDLRAFGEADMQAAVKTMRQQLNQETVPGVKVTATQEESAYSPAMERTAAVEALEKLAQQIAFELGFEVKGAGTGGASDASFVAAEGIPVLDGLGPIGGLDHSPDEYVDLKSIVPRTALLAKLIAAIAGRYD